jgi:SulP family sulfate permease
VQTLGELPHGLPPLAPLPLLDLSLIGQLANGALALAIIGLVEAVAIVRAVASHSRQRLDSNQEFVGQGLANIAAGLFSGYPCSGSFNRSALSYQSGSRTGMGSVFSGLFVLASMFLLAPVIAHLPRPVLAGTLVVTAYSMIDRRSMGRIWRGARGDTVIMVVTLAATLALPLQFAVLIGVLMSLGYYLLKTSAPRVLAVLPDDTFRHWGPRPGKPGCPQMAVVDLLGDLYFGAANHVEESLYDLLMANPRQRFLLLRMHSVQHCDISGIRALENILRICRDRGGAMYLVRVRDPVLKVMRSTGFA